MDSDARSKALDICNYFINNGINVHLIELGDQDPSDIGYKEMVGKLNNSLPISGSDIMLRRMGIAF